MGLDLQRQANNGIGKLCKRGFKMLHIQNKYFMDSIIPKIIVAYDADQI